MAVFPVFLYLDLVSYYISYFITTSECLYVYHAELMVYIEFEVRQHHIY